MTKPDLLLGKVPTLTINEVYRVIIGQGRIEASKCIVVVVVEVSIVVLMVVTIFIAGHKARVCVGHVRFDWLSNLGSKKTLVVETRPEKVNRDHEVNKEVRQPKRTTLCGRPASASGNTHTRTLACL